MLMKVSEAAKVLGVSAEHVRRMIRAGRWPYYKLGKKGTRVDVEEIKGLGRLLARAEQQKNPSNEQ